MRNGYIDEMPTASLQDEDAEEMGKTFLYGRLKAARDELLAQAREIEEAMDALSCENGVNTCMTKEEIKRAQGLIR